MSDFWPDEYLNSLSSDNDSVEEVIKYQYNPYNHNQYEAVALPCSNQRILIQVDLRVMKHLKSDIEREDMRSSSLSP